jgi:hypothetical protein
MSQGPDGSFEAAGGGDWCGAAEAGVACEVNSKEVLLWYLLVTLELFRTACAFRPKLRVRVLSATADRVQVMDAGCFVCLWGARGGPMACNNSHGISLHCSARSRSEKGFM